MGFLLVSRLNDLDGREWVKGTLSARIDLADRGILQDPDRGIPENAMLSVAPARSVLKREHPATFSERDAGRFIRFFTRRRGVVLDPFSGTGSTALACTEEDRRHIGFELYEKWHELAGRRVREALQKRPPAPVPRLRCVEALLGLDDLEPESVDFIFTSPPYWTILRKQDKITRDERVARGLPTDYGHDARDLGRSADYHDFLAKLGAHVRAWRRVTRPKGYAAVVVSDFRERTRYHLFHADVARLMEEAGFTVQGLVVLIQDNKRIHPYGYPSAFVANINNQFVVIGRRLL